ncbi:unnamed protein product [Durusdinium trenchii]|uniref:C3H1-type domain-containing protein n=1 Tax=Durusdinium trenchii TaxID=1381693 RepID=A0ABP0L8I3_9DINO
MSAGPDQSARGEEEVARKRLFRGTRLCKFFLAGCCSRGNACNFAHSQGDLKDLPDFSKTRLCDPFMKSGVCDAGDKCKFAHSHDELRPSYISKSKSLEKRPSRELREDRAPQAHPQQDPAQGHPSTAGLLHSAAMYALILQGLNNKSSSNASVSSATKVPESPVKAGPVPPGAASVLSASPRESFSRQTTQTPADASDELRTFSRQTTEERPSRQTTEETRRPLPLSQLLSLPEPEESEDSGRPPSQGSEGEELQVRLKNTFLHWEPISTETVLMRRSRSLPGALPEEHEERSASAGSTSEGPFASMSQTDDCKTAD